LKNNTLLTCMLTHMALQKLTTTKVIVTSHCCCVKLAPKQAMLELEGVDQQPKLLSHCAEKMFFALGRARLSNAFTS